MQEKDSGYKMKQRMTKWMNFSLKGVVLMLPLTSKTCTKLSRNFLIGSFFLILLLMISWVSDVHGFIPLDNLPEASIAIVYYLCCLLSGISLIFSTGAHSKILKRLTVFVHFSSVYGVALFWIRLFIPVLIVLSIFLLLPVWLLKTSTNNQKGVAIVCLGIPMLLSVNFFIRLNYVLMTSVGGWDITRFTVLLNLSGLVGLILATTLNKGKAKWILLGLNYFFAAYFHIVIFLH